MAIVKVYSTPACNVCRSLKDFLKENNVKFRDVNVAADQEAAREMIEKSGQMSVPVIEIDGNVIAGFDKKKVREALKL